MVAGEQDGFLTARTAARLLAIIIAAALALRVLAGMVLAQPLESDSLAYFTMAQGLADHGMLADQYGQHAFYSAGYPLLLTPFFALFGSSVALALAVNLLLAALSLWLVCRFAGLLAGRREAGLLAAAVFALWFPGVWNATMLAKENLSTPLFLALALCALHIARGQRPMSTALAAGALWGAALVTGGSALPLCLGVGASLILLWRREGRFTPALRAGLVFTLGALAVLTPWLTATQAMIGRPVLTTNAPFNLYLGNNPAATGKFVSIAETPLGKDWEATRLRLGEAANADRLQGEALRWIAANPSGASELALRKLVYFWAPNLPDAADFAVSRAIASIRVLEVLQYLAILVVGLLAFRSTRIARGDKWIVAAMIAGFWLIHALAYIIVRYRDPAIPLLIAMASVPVAGWLRQITERRYCAHGI